MSKQRKSVIRWLIASVVAGIISSVWFTVLNDIYINSKSELYLAVSASFLFGVVPTWFLYFIIKLLNRLSNVNKAQKIIISIIIPFVLIPVALRIAIEIDGYDPFEWEETWYVWVIVFAIIGLFEFKLFEEKATNTKKIGDLIFLNLATVMQLPMNSFIGTEQR